MGLIYYLNRNDLVKLSMKYLNICLGVLMVVVACLSIESIVYRSLQTKLNHVDQNELLLLRKNISANLTRQCDDCFNQAFFLLNVLNSIGFLISTIQASFCFLLGFYCIYYIKRQICFALSFIIVAISSTGYFAAAILTKTPPSVCCYSELRGKCDSEFAYNIRFKIIPIAALMLLVVPQLLLTALRTFTLRTFGRDSRLNRCLFGGSNLRRKSKNNRIKMTSMIMASANQTKSNPHINDHYKDYNEDYYENETNNNRNSQISNNTTVVQFRFSSADDHRDVRYSKSFDLNNNRLSTLDPVTENFEENNLIVTDQIDSPMPMQKMNQEEIFETINEKQPRLRENQESSFRELPIDCPLLSLKSNLRNHIADMTEYEQVRIKNGQIYDEQTDAAATVAAVGYLSNPDEYYLSYEEDDAELEKELAYLGKRKKVENRAFYMDNIRLNDNNNDDGDQNAHVVDWTDNIYYYIHQSQQQYRQDFDNCECDSLSSIKIYNVPTGRKFTRRSSLSTITEEKTLVNLSGGGGCGDHSKNSQKSTTAAYNKSYDNILSKDREIRQLNRSVIKNVLNEFQNKTEFFAEMLHIFEPSSKNGAFNRNIPIRFSSPSRSLHRNFGSDDQQSLVNSAISLITPRTMDYYSILSSSCRHNLLHLESKNDYFTPISNKNINTNLRNMLEQCQHNPDQKLTGVQLSKLMNVNGYDEKKFRFVKRIKNRIETKKGKRLDFELNSSSLVVTPPRSAELLRVRDKPASAFAMDSRQQYAFKRFGSLSPTVIRKRSQTNNDSKYLYELENGLCENEEDYDFDADTVGLQRDPTYDSIFWLKDAKYVDNEFATENHKKMTQQDSNSQLDEVSNYSDALEINNILVDQNVTPVYF